MNSFRPDLEYKAQDGTEFKVGAIATDLAQVPLKERMVWLPIGVLQRNNITDTSGCASRGPIAILKSKFTYFYHHGMLPELKEWSRNNGFVKDDKFVFDETFIEILSNTTPTGNSMKAPLEAIRKYGLIPELLPLEDNMTWAQYMDRNRITQKMYDLGAEFTKRFTINYEQIPRSMILQMLDVDLLDVAAYAWPIPVNGVYPKSPGSYNHAFAVATQAIDAIDSYPEYNPMTGMLEGNDFIKRLAKDYDFFDWAYALTVPKQTVPAVSLPMAFWQWLPTFLSWLWGGKIGPMPSLPKEILPEPVPDPKPSPEPAGIQLAEEAKLWIGKDASPLNRAPQELSCAEGVTTIVNRVFPGTLDASIISTISLFEALKKSKKFKAVLDPAVGTIVVSPRIGNMPGHTGIYTEENLICSNDSRTGKMQENYTRNSWRKTFIHGRGLKGYLFSPQ